MGWQGFASGAGSAVSQQGGRDEPSPHRCGVFVQPWDLTGGGSWVGASHAVPAAIPQWGKPSRTMHACTGCELAQEVGGRHVPAGLRHQEGAQKGSKAKEERSEASSTNMTATASCTLRVQAWSGESSSRNAV